MAKGITEEEVHEAADALLAEGLRPTIERLRHKLGRGSPNTVNRYVDTWWKSLSDRVQGKARGNMPAEVVRLAGRLWAAALEHARRELEGHPTKVVPGALDAVQRQLAELGRLLGQSKSEGRLVRAGMSSKRRAKQRLGRGQKARAKTQPLVLPR